MVVVIKCGSAVLVDQAGSVNRDRIEGFAADIAALHRLGHKTLLVASGAVAAGRRRLSHVNKRVLAAIGQPIVFAEYLSQFDKLGMVAAQCLFQRPDFSVYDRYLNSISSLTAMIDAGVVPIINENDFVADEDTTVGENDALAATVAIGINADRLVLFTSQPGLFTYSSWRESQRTASKNVTPQLESVVENVDLRFQKSFERTPGQGRGGVHSKVRAARLAASVGIETFIADGRVPGVLQDMFSTQNSSTGTRFPGHQVPMCPTGPRERWLLATRTSGQVVIDAGASSALTDRGGSLLVYGIVAVRGSFLNAEVVEILSADSQIGLGLSNYSSGDLRRALEAKRLLEAGRDGASAARTDLLQTLQSDEPWLRAVAVRFLEGRESLLCAAIHSIEANPDRRLTEIFGRSVREKQATLLRSLSGASPPSDAEASVDPNHLINRVLDKWHKVSEIEAGSYRLRKLIHGAEVPLLKSMALLLGEQTPFWSKVREVVARLENEEERIQKASSVYREFGQREVVHRDNLLIANKDARGSSPKTESASISDTSASQREVILA